MTWTLPILDDPETGFIVSTDTGGGALRAYRIQCVSIHPTIHRKTVSWVDRLGESHGSGTMEITPLTVERGARNVDFTLTFTAATALPDAGNYQLKITIPDGVTTELLANQVSSPHTGKLKPDTDTDVDAKTVKDNVITWEGLTLKKNEEFVTKVNDVDILDDAASFRWEIELGEVR